MSKFGILSISALALSILASAATANNVAGLMCFAREEMTLPIEDRNFVIVMEQTNPEEQDGAVLLDPETFIDLTPEMNELKFRIRVFGNASEFLEDLPTDGIGAKLMADNIPPDTYREWDDGIGGVEVRRLNVTWDRKLEAEFRIRNIEYRPETKDREYYSDSVTSADSREITCLDPYLMPK